MRLGLITRKRGVLLCGIVGAVSVLGATPSLPAAAGTFTALQAHSFQVGTPGSSWWLPGGGSGSGVPSSSGSTGGSAPAPGTVPAGADISYPQCTRPLPKGQAFGVVGLNGGLANTLNPCFGLTSNYPSLSQSELFWAVATSNGSGSQPKASIYLNTADPGDLYNSTAIADWPTTGTTPYGTCQTATVSTRSGPATLGQNSPACAWQYGYNRASQDVVWLIQAASNLDSAQSKAVVSKQVGSYPFWLDVETANSWQTGPAGNLMNQADLQGVIAALQASGVTSIGIYSTAYQWGQIIGASTESAGSLAHLPAWIPGASSLAGAQANCHLPSFTGGPVTLTQWTSGGLDQDYSCLG